MLIKAQLSIVKKLLRIKAQPLLLKVFQKALESFKQSIIFLLICLKNKYYGNLLFLLLIYLKLAY